MVWFKVCVQQALYHTPSIILPALTVNASPPSATWKYGHYDAAIFAVDDTRREQWPTSGLKGHAVVEVHLIMQPLPPRGISSSASWAARFLIFIYFADTQDLHIMPPLPVHEQPAAHLAKAINKWMEAIPYDKLLIDITMHLNYRIQNKDSTNIPDLHLTVTAQPPEDMESDEMAIAKSVSKWVGECGLSLDMNCMVRKLSITCDGHQDINYALVISFKERARWQQPKEENITAQQLRSAPPLDYEEFIPSRIKKSLRFGPVELKSHIWIDISEVHYTVYKRGTDSHFDFNNKNAATFAEGTLYPTLQMDDVEWMLSDAAESLKGYIILLMEGMGLEESAIQSAPYCRYLDWRNHKYDKHKTAHVNVQSSDSSTQQTSTSFSSILMTSSSDATTSSSDGTVSTSAGLSLDVQPECSAKKSKIQPEGKCDESKVKPKKKGNGKGKGR
ncbi:hypothetical protein EV702DRAFT_1199670 [Suillus placidus]|uniref:DUF6830 domain-containing protein n=1 Tax=Suillus placidus TaxID=48579 RepID=A0A9P6ZQV1_9AGAM|nr:hypothetical protein EV702DRAFT_1199670 [Suillus placidus]